MPTLSECVAADQADQIDHAATAAPSAARPSQSGLKPSVIADGNGLLLSLRDDAGAVVAAANLSPVRATYLAADLLRIVFRQAEAVIK